MRHPFSALTLFIRRQEGHPAFKNILLHQSHRVDYVEVFRDRPNLEYTSKSTNRCDNYRVSMELKELEHENPQDRATDAVAQGEMVPTWMGSWKVSDNIWYGEADLLATGELKLSSQNFFIRFEFDI